MREDVKKNYSNITFNNLALPRYIKVKDSINDLLNVIDREKVEVDGTDRFLNALLQLIEENDGKTVDEKYDDITDAIYKGNVFSNYFEEDNKKHAVEVLSQTSLLNDEEKFIYIINFLMPDDQDFSRVYSECGKNPKKIIQAYHLNENDSQLVLGRIMEVSKFFRQYQAEKERAYALKVSDVVKTATNNPTDENIARAKEEIKSLPNGELKASLESQLVEAEQDVALEEPKMLDPKKLKEGFASLGKGEAFMTEEPVKEEIAVEDETVVEEEQDKLEESEPNMTFDDLLTQNDPDLELSSPVEPEIILPTKVETERVIDEVESILSESELEDVTPEDLPVEENIVTVEEPEVKIEEPTVSQEGEQVGQDVMTALQKIVATAKDNAKRVEELEAELSKKDEEIKGLNDIVSEQEKNLIEKETKINSQDQEISSYRQELSDKDLALENANKIISEKDVELANKDSQLADKDTELSSVTTTLNSYKNAYSEIQHLVASAQTQVLTAEDNQKKV